MRIHTLFNNSGINVYTMIIIITLALTFLTECACKSDCKFDCLKIMLDLNALKLIKLILNKL